MAMQTERQRDYYQYYQAHKAEIAQRKPKTIKTMWPVKPDPILSMPAPRR